VSFIPTPEQSRIIGHPLRPLRVAAGAGTGKTATVVHRLARLIGNGVSPERSVGITFTNKAADELAARLRAVLPDLAAAGREVEVTTYHGFAYALLQEYGAIVGVERDTEIIGPGYVRQLLQEATSRGEYHHLDLTWAPSLVEQAAQLAEQLAHNLMTPEQALTSDDPGPVGAARHELLAIIGRYAELKRSLGVVDYGDLILLAHRLLSSSPAVAATIASRYDVAVLDEYQDTDPAQRELLRLIFGNGFPLTAVGDVDQTIYEWRGASTANFDRFPEHFTDGDGNPAVTLQLTESRRSGRNILDVAHRIRTRIYQDEQFAALRPRTGSREGEVHARFLRTAVDEAEWIAAEIVRLHEEEGLSWHDVAVVFRRNRDMALIRDALQASEVPVEVGSLGGLLDVPDVATLHAWLRIIARPDDSIALAGLLLGPHCRLGLGDVAQLQRCVASTRRDDTGLPLLAALERLDQIEFASPTTRPQLAALYERYERLVVLAQGKSLVDLCRHILDESGAWAEIEGRQPGLALTARVNLYRFLDIAERWSPLRGRPTLEAFLSYLDAVAADAASAELDTANIGSEDAVTLLTIHRAKGLEWNTVFVPDRLARLLPYRLRLDPPVVGRVAEAERVAALQLIRDRQEWRAAYVAATRAGERLYLTGSHWHGSAKNPRHPSEVFVAATEAEATEVAAAPPDPGDRPLTLSIATTQGAPDPTFPDGWLEAMRATLQDPGWPQHRAAGQHAAYDAAMEQIRMVLDDLPTPPTTATALGTRPDTSVTGMVTLADCPQRYYWSEVDPLPRRPAPALRRGSRIHRLIEVHGRGQLVFGDADDSRHDLSAAEGATGRPDPYQVYLASRFAATRPRFIETPISLELPTATVRGRIDAVYEPRPGEWEIVDFKSGRRSENPTTIVQLEAYAVAAATGALAPNPPETLKVTFAYLGGGSLEEVSAVADRGWVREARHHLVALGTAAAGPEFPAVPSARCDRCDFLRFCDPGRAFLAESDH
jgi:DNA helicase-2/ATP-dependent DNA helicase PcrA